MHDVLGVRSIDNVLKHRQNPGQTSSHHRFRLKGRSLIFFWSCSGLRFGKSPMQDQLQSSTIQSTNHLQSSPQVQQKELTVAVIPSFTYWFLLLDKWIRLSAVNFKLLGQRYAASGHDPARGRDNACAEAAHSCL